MGKRGFFPLRARGVMYPMQQVHVDHLGTLEVVEGKFQHVLVVVDAATRFVWLEPVEFGGGVELGGGCVHEGGFVAGSFAGFGQRGCIGVWPGH